MGSLVKMGFLRIKCFEGSSNFARSIYALRNSAVFRRKIELFRKKKVIVK